MSKSYLDTATILLGIREQLLTWHNLTGTSLRPGSKCSWAQLAAVGRVHPDVLVASRHEKALRLKVCVEGLCSERPNQRSGSSGPTGRSRPKHKAVSQLRTSTCSSTWCLLRTSAQILLTCGSNTLFFFFICLHKVSMQHLSTLAA